MAKQIIYDFETLDNKPTSVVLSMAILVFDPSELVDFEVLVGRAKRIKFDWRQQLGGRRTMGDETVSWWKHPDQAVPRARVIDYDGSEVPLERMPLIVEQYLTSMGYDATDVDAKVWTRGNEFDPPIMNDIYHQLGADMPYSWWNIRDVRTYIDGLTQLVDPNYKWRGNDYSFQVPDGFIKHVEEHDCAVDVMKMQWATFKVLNLMSNLQKEVPEQYAGFVSKLEAKKKAEAEKKKAVDFDDDIPF